MEKIEEQSGQKPAAILADSGYCSEPNLAHLAEKQIEGYLAAERQKHGAAAPSRHGPLPKGATRVEQMRRKLQTKAGKAVYAARKGIVEPVFEQIKQARGFREFLLRGLAKVQGKSCGARSFGDGKAMVEIEAVSVAHVHG